MSLSASEIALALEELSPWCEGAKISKIRGQGDWDLYLELRKDRETRHLLLSVHPKASRLHFASRPPGTGEDPSAFVQLLRARLEGGWVEKIWQVEGDRLVEISCQGRSARGEEAPVSYSLLCRLMGIRSGVLLLEPSGRVLGSLGKAEGATSKGKAVSLRSFPPRDFFEKGEGTLSERIAAHYEELLSRAQEEEERASWLRALERERGRVRRLREKLSSGLERTGDPAVFRERGELLKAYAAKIRKGEKKAVLEAFEGPGRVVEIELDPKLSAGENADEYFRQAKRAERARREIGARLSELEKRDASLGNLEKDWEKLSSEEVSARARELSLSPGKGGAPSQKSAAPEEEPKTRRAFDRLRIRPQEHVSPAGKKIFVGRTAQENDVLTTKFARPHDYFFHAVGTSGAHVIVRLEKRETLDPETLRLAARLALEKSGFSKSGRGEVGYAECRHVRKRRGDPPGAVHVVGPMKTVWVELAAGKKA
ncbi:MAG: NFACT RNA binding domain-containing protein [Bdellovibrionota bacterium]